MTYIQYGNITIRDFPPPTPPHAGAARKGAGGRCGVGWGWGMGNPSWVCFHVGYRILDIHLCVYKHIYKYYMYALNMYLYI